ncbi:MAG: Tripartite tricarboxylate transporter TctB family [Deltaproteobacteria bacterium]|nr:Tripartite tricarboxylate transporter TctB family [Deltaproteobacteria bacterium]
MPRLSKNTWCALVVIAGTLIYLAEAWKLPFGNARNPDIGFLPILIGFTVIGISLIMIGVEFFRPAVLKKETDLFDDDEKGESTGLRKPLILGAAILVYPPAFVHLGFIPSSILLLGLSLRLMEYRGWLGSLIVAALITFSAYFLFGHWLHVNFPKGILG